MHQAGQALLQALRHVGLWNQSDLNAGLARCCRRCVTDGRYFECCWNRKGNPQLLGPVGKCQHRISAGENKPVVPVQLPQSLVKRIKTGWRTNLQHGNLNRLGTKCTQTLAQLAGLVHGTGYQHASARKWQRTHCSAPC